MGNCCRERRKAFCGRDQTFVFLVRAELADYSFSGHGAGPFSRWCAALSQALTTSGAVLTGHHELRNRPTEAQGVRIASNSSATVRRVSNVSVPVRQSHSRVLARSSLKCVEQAVWFARSKVLRDWAKAALNAVQDSFLPPEVL